MQIDVGAVFTSEFEDASDMRGTVRIISWSPANNFHAAFQTLFDICICFRNIVHAFLRENAQL